MVEKKAWRLSELQRFLQERGVCVGQSRKAELFDLVQKALDIGLPVDPECCAEDQVEVIGAKLKDGNIELSNPALLSGTTDLNILPEFSIFDICTYLLNQNMNLSAIRDYRRSEAYSLMQDGYVNSLETIQMTDGYFAVKASVKPRTRDRDPVTKAPFYFTWSILTKVDVDTRSCILSAFCTCKGGLEGACNHVAALLYTLVDITQKKKDGLDASTSHDCKWRVPRKRHLSLKKAQHLHAKKAHRNEPEGNIPSGVDISSFTARLKLSAPRSGWLTNYSASKEDPPETQLNSTPEPQFMFADGTDLRSPKCLESFRDFVISIQCTTSEHTEIEASTRDQGESQNWHTARAGRLTSSHFGEVFRRQATTKPDNLLKVVLGYQEVPANVHVVRGRQKEVAARHSYTLHMKGHPGLTVRKSGLIMDEGHPFLATSPDGLVTCPHCAPSQGLSEIKCPSVHRDKTPKEATAQD